MSEKVSPEITPKNSVKYPKKFKCSRERTYLNIFMEKMEEELGGKVIIRHIQGGFRKVMCNLYSLFFLKKHRFNKHVGNMCRGTTATQNLAQKLPKQKKNRKENTVGFLHSTTNVRHL